MTALSEARWWAKHAARLTNAPGPVIVVVAAVWLTLPWSGWFVAGVVVLTAGLRLWAVLSPTTFIACARFVVGPLWKRRISSAWGETCRRCGLLVDDQAPTIVSRRVIWPHVELTVSPLLGQTFEHFEAVSERLRTAAGVTRLRIQPAGVRDVLLTYTVADHLRAPFSAAPVAEPDLASVDLGRREDGKPWSLAIGPHTLVAGCSGAGKGSVFWSFAFGLAGAVKQGTVQLHGIDLKGGMEILMGRELFTTAATDGTQAAALLEELVVDMQERTQRYAGRQRSHVATLEEPLHVVMIDELAALTAYNNDRELQRRAEIAINLLCSQGRAPGFMVFACLQDPRKEVIPSRGLFTQMIGLRLKDVSETTMVLGDTAALSGAHCHRIGSDQPGTGYVLPEDGSHPIRVRAGYASDDAIRDVAHRFASPQQRQISVAAFEESLRSRTRRSRAGEVAS